MEGVVPYPPEFVERYRARGYWLDRPLWDLFLERVFDRFPERVALVSGGERVTYAELGRRALALAGRLARLGIGRLDPVVLQLPNVPEFAYCYFALQRLGAVPIMALPAHRELELRHLVSLARASAYIGDDPDLAAVVRQENPQLRVVVLRQDLDWGPGGPPLPEVEVDPLDPALFLLSGGTTGLPKLIPRTHNDYWYNSVLAAGVNDIRPDDALLVVLPLGHNFPLACPGLQGFLQRGARVVLSTTTQAGPNFELIARERITHLELVPALLIRWLNDPALEAAELDSVRIVNTGGQRLQPEVKGLCERSLAGCTVQEVFGMAEGLLNFVRLDDPEEVRRETAGRPLSPDDEIQVVDEELRPVPPGQVGELIVRGPYTIRGYFRAPEHNALAFTPDGFYRTGDLVRVHPSGNLVVEGRKKDLINRAGEKISAEEVENLIIAHPNVVEVACVPVPDPVLGERMCACVVLRPGTSLSLEELCRFLLAKGMAKFKLPERLEVMDELPTTQVGKVSKRELARRLGR